MQIVTDGVFSYVGVSMLLERKYPNIFWRLWAAHCIIDILKDTSDLLVHNAIIEKTRRITIFMYHHSFIHVPS